MKLHSHLPLLVGLALGLLSSAGQSQTLESIDFTALEGTNWGESLVRLNFGADAGMGTVTFASVNGGAFQNALTPGDYNLAPYSAYNGPTTLSDGSIFSPTQESFFSTLPSSLPGLSGFTMTVTLDSGLFPEGSVFSARSFGRMDSNSQYLRIESGLAPPDSVQLPTDGVGSADLVLIDSATQLYGPAGNGGASKGLAFDIVGNSFSVSFLTTQNYQPGGEAMTIATPVAVPEPSGAVLIGMLGIATLIRRRRRA